MLCSHSVQEVADLANAAHLILKRVPICFTSLMGLERVMKFKMLNLLIIANGKKLLPQEAIARFRAKALNPHGNAVTRGGAENDDIYFQGKEAQNTHFGPRPWCYWKKY